MKKLNVFLMAIFLSLLIATLSFGWQSKGVKTAQDFVDVGRIDEAINTLERWIAKEAKDFDAYWMLAGLYMKKGQYQYAEEQYGYALKLKPQNSSQVTAKFKDAFIASFNRGDIYTAKILAKILIKKDPAYRPTAFQLFYEKGRTIESAEYLQIALEFASSQNERVAVAKQFLKLKLDGKTNNVFMFRQATKILGKDFVDEVMPSQKTEVVWSRTYTDADADKDGVIQVFAGKEIDVENEDILLVKPEVPKGADKVYVANHKDWVPVPKQGEVKLFYTGLSKDDLKNKCHAIWIEKGKGVKVHAKVLRVIKKAPNYTLLSSD